MGILQDSLQVMRIAARLANPELLERVTALNEQVVELSSKNVELQERAFGIDRELQQAYEKLRLIGEVERRDDFIYLKGETAPSCPRCFDVDRKIVHIIETRHPKIGIHPLCPECETSFAVYPQGLRGRS
jgi:hypothetical protein